MLASVLLHPPPHPPLPTSPPLPQELSLEHTAVGDEGLAAAARGLPRLRALTLANHISLGHLALLPGAARRARRAGLLRPPHCCSHGCLPASCHAGSWVRASRVTQKCPALLPANPRSGVTDAGLQRVAAHCHQLERLAVTGSRRVGRAGVLQLAGLGARAPGGPHPAPDGLAVVPAHWPAPGGLPGRLTSLALSHTSATDGAVCELLQRCTQLRALELRGLLFNVDATAACLAGACRHLTALDLRHCSTLSGGWGRGQLRRRRHLSLLRAVPDDALSEAVVLCCCLSLYWPGMHPVSMLPHHQQTQAWRSWRACPSSAPSTSPSA